MSKKLRIVCATSIIAALLCSSANALPLAGVGGVEPQQTNIIRVWDNCGVGSHRASWGECISNWAVGPGTNGCPPGYHWGNYTHACFPNHF